MKRRTHANFVFKNMVFFTGMVFFVAWAMPSQATTFRIATLSPGGSFWVKTIKDATQKIAQKTEGRVKFKIFPGGVMGGEQVVLRKMRIGQLQGAAVSVGALYDIYPDLTLYSVPFLFEDYNQVSYVRERLDATIKEGAQKKGYVVPAIIGGGFAYALSQKPVRVFEDFKERKIWVPERDQQTAENLRELGLNPVPLALGDVLMGLETDLIDTVAAPPVVAIVLQWHTRVSHVLQLPIMPTHVSLVLDKKVFDKLSQKDKDVVMKHLNAAGTKIEDKNLADNDDAIQAMAAQGVKIIKPSKKEQESWQAMKERAKKQAFDTSRISTSLLDKLAQYVKEYQQKQVKNK